MIRTITYEVLAETKIITPATKQWGGMQYEDEATEIIFDIKNLNISKALYRIDFNSAGAGYQPSTNLTCSNNKISRKIPKLITQFGGEVQVTAVITELDANNKTTGVCYSYPVIIYFTAVEKSNHTGETVEGNISVMETSVKEMLDKVTELKNTTVSAASEAEAAQAATEAARTGMMESGTEWVFLGGDASGSVNPDITVDNALNTGSINPVQNKVVAKALEEQRYLLESGFSDDGFWFYKKWSDGSAECWGRQTINTAFTTVAKPITIGTVSYPILYSGDEHFPTVDYPFEFAEAPCENVRIHSRYLTLFQTTQAITGGAGLNTTEHTGAYGAARVAEYDTAVDVIADYFVVGRWK